MRIEDDGYVIRVEPSVYSSVSVFIRVEDSNTDLFVGSHWPPDKARKIALAILDAMRGIDNG